MYGGPIYDKLSNALRKKISLQKKLAIVAPSFEFPLPA
jgi:hypothetical protein